MNRKKTGYGIIYRDVIFMPTIGKTAKLVYTALCSMTGDKDYCFPSYDFLCYNLQMSRATLSKALDELEANKVIIRDTEKGKSSTYTVTDQKDFSTSSETEPVQKMNYTSSKNELQPVQKLNYKKNNKKNIKNNSQEENQTSFNPQKKENDSSAPRPRADTLLKAVTENRQNATKTFDYTELPYFNTKLIVWQNQNNKKGDPIEKYVKAFKKWERETDTSQLNDSRHVINTFFLNVGKYLEKKPVAAVFRKPSF